MQLSSTFNKIIHDLFTEKDGITWDYTKVTGTVGIVWWMANQTYALIAGQTFNPETAAFGLSGLVLAVGGSVAMRKMSGDSTDDDSTPSK